MKQLFAQRLSLSLPYILFNSVVISRQSCVQTTSRNHFPHFSASVFLLELGKPPDFFKNLGYFILRNCPNLSSCVLPLPFQPHISNSFSLLCISDIRTPNNTRSIQIVFPSLPFEEPGTFHPHVPSTAHESHPPRFRPLS